MRLFLFAAAAPAPARRASPESPILPQGPRASGTSWGPQACRLHPLLRRAHRRGSKSAALKDTAGGAARGRRAPNRSGKGTHRHRPVRFGQRVTGATGPKDRLARSAKNRTDIRALALLKQARDQRDADDYMDCRRFVLPFSVQPTRALARRANESAFKDAPANQNPCEYRVCCRASQHCQG